MTLTEVEKVKMVAIGVFQMAKRCAGCVEDLLHRFFL
jgi:hypothetical protein